MRSHKISRVHVAMLAVAHENPQEELALEDAAHGRALGRDRLRWGGMAMSAWRASPVDVSGSVIHGDTDTLEGRIFRLIFPMSDSMAWA